MLTFVWFSKDNMCGNDLLKAGTLVVIIHSHNTSSWAFYGGFPFGGSDPTQYIGGLLWLMFKVGEPAQKFRPLRKHGIRVGTV